MNSSAISAPVLDPATLSAIDLFLEEFYTTALKAGEAVAKVELKTSQIRGLETLIVSTRRFSEIINYIKNQTGKERGGRQKWGTIAETLLSQLKLIEEKAIEIGRGDPSKTIEIKLRLARGWCRQVVAHYLYANIKPCQEDGNES